MTYRSTRQLARSAGIAVAAVLLGSTAAVAQTTDGGEFYKGKTLTIVVGQEAGTGFDIYSRTLARHFSRHIPGQPSIVVQNMPGASGVNAGNWLYNIAAKDGTVIGTFSQNVVLEPLMGNAQAKYDATKMIWIGNMEESASVCAMAPENGVARFDELTSKEVLFGATGPTGPLGQAARALNALAGTKMKIIFGYKGSATVKLAIQKGEVRGICGLPWSTLKAFWKDMLDAGTLKPVIQLSAKKLPALGDIPHIDDLVKGDEQRQIVDLIFGQLVLGRIYMTPPGVPGERVKTLRGAFNATMADKEFLADAQRTRIDITPATGETVEGLIQRFYKASPVVVERAKAAVSGN